MGGFQIHVLGMAGPDERGVVEVVFWRTFTTLCYLDSQYVSLPTL